MKRIGLKTVAVTVLLAIGCSVLPALKARADPPLAAIQPIGKDSFQPVGKDSLRSGVAAHTITLKGHCDTVSIPGSFPI